MRRNYILPECSYLWRANELCLLKVLSHWSQLWSSWFSSPLLERLDLAALFRDFFVGAKSSIEASLCYNLRNIYTIYCTNKSTTKHTSSVVLKSSTPLVPAPPESAEYCENKFPTRGEDEGQIDPWSNDGLPPSLIPFSLITLSDEGVNSVPIGETPLDAQISANLLFKTSNAVVFISFSSAISEDFCSLLSKKVCHSTSY